MHAGTIEVGQKEQVPGRVDRGRAYVVVGESRYPGGRVIDIAAGSMRGARRSRRAGPDKWSRGRVRAGLGRFPAKLQPVAFGVNRRCGHRRIWGPAIIVAAATVIGATQPTRIARLQNAARKA